MKKLFLSTVLAVILTVTMCLTAYGETWKVDCNTCSGDKDGAHSCTLLYCKPPIILEYHAPEETPHPFMKMSSGGEPLFQINYSGEIRGESGRIIGQLNKRELQLFRQFMKVTHTWSLTGADK